MKRVFPYPVLAKETVLDVENVSVDGAVLDMTMLSSTEHTIALHVTGRESWNETRLSVRISPPVDELASPRWSTIENLVCAAVVVEKRTNTRTVHALRPEKDGTWIGTVVLRGDHHRARAELSGSVIANVDGVLGRMIGWTEQPWIIDLEARAPTRDRSAETVWADFADPSNAHLLPFRNDPWTVDATGRDPCVYLNSRFEGLPELLDAPPRSPLAALSRVTSAQIVRDSWVAMFYASLSLVQVEEGEAQWPGDWQETVLRAMLPIMYPDFSPADALLELVEQRRNEEEEQQNLHARVMHAAAQQAGVSKGLTASIRSLRTAE